MDVFQWYIASPHHPFFQWMPSSAVCDITDNWHFPIAMYYACFSEMQVNEEGCVTEMHAHLHTQLTLTRHSQHRIKNRALDILKPTWKIAAAGTWKP